jgi:hypothetical protein
LRSYSQIITASRYKAQAEREKEIIIDAKKANLLKSFADNLNFLFLLDDFSRLAYFLPQSAESAS